MSRVAGSSLPDRNAMKSVYCSNKACKNGRPIGKALIYVGSAASYVCPLCKARTVVVGQTPPHWA